MVPYTVEQSQRFSSCRIQGKHPALFDLHIHRRISFPHTRDKKPNLGTNKASPKNLWRTILGPDRLSLTNAAIWLCLSTLTCAQLFSAWGLTFPCLYEMAVWIQLWTCLGADGRWFDKLNHRAHCIATILELKIQQNHQPTNPSLG